MKIYFAGSIRGGREHAQLYRRLIGALSLLGTVLTEHVGNALPAAGENKDDRAIFERDMRWLESADVVIAEVTTPSLGVGFEIGRAVLMGKRTLCLHQSGEGRRTSAMIAGCPNVTLIEYTTFDEAEEAMKRFVASENAP
jgi:nucleoside 2-deoxyribosyltransferase